MAETKDVVLGVVETELKQKQTVLDLDSGTDAEILLIYKKFTANDKAPVTVQLAAAAKLVSPDEKRVEALCAYATSQAYRVAKEGALSKGNYLSAQLRSKIVGIMQNLDAFSELSAKECFERWLSGYKDKANVKRQASAAKLLERAKATEEFSDL